jgi:hypothetical protein
VRTSVSSVGSTPRSLTYSPILESRPLTAGDLLTEGLEGGHPTGVRLGRPVPYCSGGFRRRQHRPGQVFSNSSPARPCTCRARLWGGYGVRDGVGGPPTGRSRTRSVRHATLNNGAVDTCRDSCRHRIGLLVPDWLQPARARRELMQPSEAGSSYERICPPFRDYLRDCAS